MAAQRIDWADYAKGLTIILVVYGHATVGVSKDVPIDAAVYAYAMKPFSQFRMPVFFFVAGVFAALSLQRDWPTFVERTLLPLLYVFVLWNLLQWGARSAFAPWANTPIDIWRIFVFPIHPINITWFIWALIAYFLASYATRKLPAALVVAFAAVLAATPVPGDWHYVYQQAPRFFVYFALGIACSSWMSTLETGGRARSLGLLALAYFVIVPLTIHQKIDEVPLVDFANSLLGIALVVTVCMVLAEHGWLRWLRWVGNWSLPIFVTHTIVTAGVRETFLRLDLANDPFLLIVLGTVAGVLVPIGFACAMRSIGFPWLFERPKWLMLARPRKSAELPA